MKTSAVLAAAKPYLDRKMRDWRRGHESHRYLCFAVASACARRKITLQDCRRVKMMIAEKLDGCKSLEEWLEKYHGIRELHYRYGTAGLAQMEYEAYRNKMQVTRHAWVDSMIAEFQKKGD